MKKIFILSGLGAVIFLGSLSAYYGYRDYNIILITIDTLRADYLSCYNPQADPTPNLDTIARKSVVFTRAYSLIPITMPSHTAMLTSRSPHHLKIFNNGDVFEYKVPLLTDFLRSRNYRTAAFVSLGVLNGTYGLGKGFELYQDSFDGLNGRYYKTAAEVHKVALPWLESQKGNRFFAWIHYSDPHEPYITVDAAPDTEIRVNGVPVKQVCMGKRETIVLEWDAHPGMNEIRFRTLNQRKEEGTGRYLNPEIFIDPSSGMERDYGPEWKEEHFATLGTVHYFQNTASLKIWNHNGKGRKIMIRFSGGVMGQSLEVIRRNYTAEVQYVDRHIGELWQKLEEWGIRNRTIVIVTSDHGEGLRTHGGLGHVGHLYEEVIHVPLLFYYPGLGRHGRVEEPVSHLDLMPTILDILEIDNRAVMEGRSLRPFLTWWPFDFPSFSNRRMFSATYRPEAPFNAFSVRQGEWKLIHYPQRKKKPWEAFNLQTDPGEKKNLAVEDSFWKEEKIIALKKLLEEFCAEAEEAHSGRKNPEPGEEEQRMLRGLGYISGQ